MVTSLRDFFRKAFFFQDLTSMIGNVRSDQLFLLFLSLKWATALSVESSEVWQREVTTRRQFLQQFSSHFLTSLFPGLDDLPPDFATQPPDKFDDTLPKVWL